jgi:hypothetical protein
MKQEGKLVKVSMNVPPDVWKALKFKALEENTTATEILVRLAKDYLKQPRRRQKQ